MGRSFIRDRDRLMGICAWTRKEATLAVRYYRKTDTLDELAAAMYQRRSPTPSRSGILSDIIQCRLIYLHNPQAGRI